VSSSSRTAALFLASSNPLLQERSKSFKVAS
jgi:hypothetical protein